LGKVDVVADGAAHTQPRQRVGIGHELVYLSTTSKRYQQPVDILGAGVYRRLLRRLFAPKMRERYEKTAGRPTAAPAHQWLV
jgi:hypothetical protein